MKRKILSIALCLTLLFTTVFTGFTVVSAEETDTTTENLISNGDFAEYEGTTPTNWATETSENATVEIVEAQEIADGVTANAVKFTTSADNNGKRSNLYYTDTVEIEKNAKYTTTFWVKVKNIAGFRVYMYEPTYTDVDGVVKTNPNAAEGRNIYTFTYDNGSTRVIRTDIKHSFNIVESGTVIDATGPSMFISRYQGTEQPLTPDYPSTERQDEWFQIIHTFETGNDDAHKADVAYQFSAPETVDGELWIANVQMTVDRYYVPAVNDDTLGSISEGTKFPVTTGDELTLTAKPFGENLFNGWYVGDELVSEDAALTFTYNGNATPNYVAHFEEAGLGTAETFEEGYTKGQTVAQATSVIGTESGTYTEFANTELNGSGFFVDSGYTGTWRKATISTDYAHSGDYSLLFSGQYGNIGYKYTGLEKNTNYTLSVWGYLTYTASNDWAGVNQPIVTPATASYQDSASRLASEWSNTKWANIINDWTEITIDVNTGDSTEIIFWLPSSGTSAKLYLDDYSIAREAVSYTPNVNDSTLGSVTTVKTRIGSKTTVKATPMGEAIFDGWYNGDTLLSTDEKYSFIYSDEAANYEAHFTGTGFGIDGGYENYTNGTILAQEVSFASASDYTETLYLDSTKDDGVHFVNCSYTGNNWRKATVTNAMAYSGKQSLMLSAQYGFVGRKITGLTANTDYIISFYAYLTYANDGKSAGIGQTIITNGSTAVIGMNDSGSLYNKNVGEDGVIYKNATVNSNVIDKWEKVTVEFNSGENEDVILWLNPVGTSAVLYIDDMAITRTADIVVENSAYGSTTKTTGVIGYNQKVNVTATPYDGNTFDGWYVGDECVSTDASYTFLAPLGETVLTPKFSGTTYEHFAYNGEDGTFENGTVDGWVFSDPNYTSEWCDYAVSSAMPYEGNNSLRFDARHRNSILTLDNLEENTNYTLSFYFYINEIEAPANNVEGAEIKKAQLRADIVTTDITHVYGETETLGSSGVIYSTASWQKVEVTFNTGSNTELNLIIRYANETSVPMYLDSLSLLHKDTVEPEVIPGDLNGSDVTDLDDVNALAQYLAGWEVIVNEELVDVNGDSAVNLKDLVLLARFVAGWDVTIS